MRFEGTAHIKFTGSPFTFYFIFFKVSDISFSMV